MDRQVILMQGVSGSGKSTLARMLAAKSGRGIIVSADDFFYDASGKYNHDPNKLDDAHNDCFLKFLRALVDPQLDLIIVDNTNTLSADCAPYMRGASAFGWKARIVRVVCDPKVALARNAGRAPAKVVDGQARNLTFERFPAYWTMQSVVAGASTIDDKAVSNLLRWPVLTKGEARRG